MKTDKISLKPVVLCAMVLFLSVLALIITAFLAESKSIKNTLLITPSQIGIPGINISRIEEFTETDFLLTYEIKSQDRISLDYADFPVTVIAANSCYQQIKKYSMIEGAFFPKQSWTGKQKHAVLNEAAANAVFGSGNITGSLFKLRGETWLVTGVINDRDNDTSRVYIPSSITGGSANSFLALLSVSAGYDETLIINSLKKLGIHGTSYDFINLDTQRNCLFERAYIIFLFILCFVLIFIMLVFINKFIHAFLLLKKELNNHYFAQVFKRNIKVILKPVWLGFPLLLSPILALTLLLRAVSVILPWQDIVSLKGKREIFYPYVDTLYNFDAVSFFIFIFSLIFLTFSVILFIRRYHAIFKF